MRRDPRPPEGPGSSANPKQRVLAVDAGLSYLKLLPGSLGSFLTSSQNNEAAGETHGRRMRRRMLIQERQREREKK